jgi:hypothetical protein
MSTLLSALTTKDTLTENGMATNTTSSNSCVDLFFTIGASRNADRQTLINNFIHALHHDKLAATKILFWARDVRGGAGERKVFRDILHYLAENHTNIVLKNLHLISEYGRWDDLFSLIGTKVENEVLQLIKNALHGANGLCAKWLPRPNVKDRIKKNQASVIRKFLKLTPKEYRQFISRKSNTVEQLMCSKNWSAIDYSKVPSKALSDYAKSFSKNDSTRYSEFLLSVEKGETKMNAGALYPYDVVKNLKYGETTSANLQWQALPNYMENCNERVLPVCDVSGSMQVNATPSISCLDISVSLGLYISERNVGPFKDAFITFSETPQLQYLKGNLKERYDQLSCSDWGMSTDIEAVFDLILNKAVEQKVPESEMPTMILILSDMEFNQAGGDDWNKTAQELFETKYQRHGYNMPKIVYWNMASRNKNIPVKFGEDGTAMISGFSPSILKSILSGDNISPLKIMNNTINSSRYEAITV